jgi:5-methylcytosine-specific restriction endonuclease McrA
MTRFKFCEHHGVVPFDHKCWNDGAGGRRVGTDNERRAQLSKRHGLKTAYWRKLRQQALARDGGLCALRHPGCTGRAETVHISAHLHGNHLAATLSDCRSACRRCHGKQDAPRATSPRTRRR